MRDRVARHLLETGRQPRCLHCVAAAITLSYRQIHTALRGTDAHNFKRQYGRCSQCGRSRLVVTGTG